MGEYRRGAYASWFTPTDIGMLDMVSRIASASVESVSRCRPGQPCCSRGKPGSTNNAKTKSSLLRANHLAAGFHPVQCRHPRREERRCNERVSDSLDK